MDWSRAYSRSVIQELIASGRTAEISDYFSCLENGLV